MMRQARLRASHLAVLLLILHSSLFTLTGCIEPPLNLPAEEVVVDMPIVITDMEVVWNIDVDLQTDWYYGWDEEDEKYFGSISYPKPTNFEVRRYYLGENAGGKHNREGMDGFTIYGTRFRRTYQFGYYDMLLWSNIDSPDQTQVVVINEDNIDEVRATTTVTRGAYLNTKAADAPLTALFNQPEIFYSTYPQDIHISQNLEDYDYYDEEEKTWVKQINCVLEPLVYIYLVQIIVYNNEDARVRSISGDCAVSGFANSTSVNTGHTGNAPCMVYFNTMLKKNKDVRGRRADIIGGKLTTYGLCDMEGYSHDTRAQYSGSRTDVHNYLIFELNMSGGSIQKCQVDITEQCQKQCHGGIITVELDAGDIPNPVDDPGSGSIFQPKVEDYDELIYDIPM